MNVGIYVKYEKQVLRLSVHDWTCKSHSVFEPRHEETYLLHMRKQRRSSANRAADQRLFSIH